MTRTLRSTLQFIGAAALLLSSACSSSSSPTLSSIAVAPAAASVAIGHTQALTATGTFSDGSTAAVPDAIWTTSSATVATVSTSGLVTAKAAGSATITATAAGHTGSAAITVSAAALSSIAATAASATLAIGGTDQITVTGTYDDGSHQNLSASATYTPTPATGVVTVSAGGLISGVAAGTASIAVSAGGKTAPAPVSVTVSAPVLASLALTPSPVRLALAGATQQLVVTGSYDVGPTQVLTASTTFTISPATGVATVSNGGLVTAVADGVAVVTATVGAVHGTVSVIVGSPDLANVFVGGTYATGVSFVSFVDPSVLNAVSIDAATHLTGKTYGSLKVVLPTDTTKFTGGALVDAGGARDLSAFDSVTFWAKASEAVTLDLAGLGNNAGPNSGVEAEVHGLAITTAWQQFTIPVPLPSKFTSVDGLFHFAHGTSHSSASNEVDVWFSDIQYAALGAGALGVPSPAWVAQAQSVSTGGTYQITDTDLSVSYTIQAAPLTLASINPAYFTFASNSSSATVDASGLVTAVGAGSANITAKLGNLSVPGQLAISVTQPAGGPTTLPPAPAQIAGANVISLYSSVPGGYNGTASDKSGNIDTWLTCWSQGNNPTAGGNPFSVTDGAHTANPRKYVFTAGAGGYAGVELLGKTGATSPGSCGGTINTTHELDISAMDHFHVDVWTPDASNVQVNLVDAGADGTLTGGTTNGNVTLNGLSSPTFTNGVWLSYDIPLSIGGSSFQNGNWVNAPGSLKHLGQMVFTVPNGGTVYFDNIYFYKGSSAGGGSSPTTVPAVPTAAVSAVKSLLSTTYSGTAADYSAKVDSYDSPCEGAGGTVSDFTIPGTTHSVKQYAINANDFAILELIGASGGTSLPALCSGGAQTGANELDASALDTLHFDVWSANGSGNFQVHLINAGADGYINQGPGASAGQGNGTADFASGANTVGKGAWVSFDVKFSALGAGAGALNRIGMVKFFTTDAGIYFLDNLYFYKATASGSGTPPTAAAPTPGPAVADVVSLYNSGGKYTDEAGTTFQTSWSVGSVTNFTVSGTSSVVKEYTGVEYVGVDFTPVNATAAGLTTMHVDLWTPNATGFAIKLGLAGGGTQVQIPFDNSVIKQNQWVSLDVPLASFGGIDLTNINELLWVDNVVQPLEHGTFYIDNVYFYKGGTVAPTGPATLPPVPSHPVANVISLYSSVTGGYNGTAADKSGNVDTWLTCWSAGAGGDPISPAISVGSSSAAPREYVMTGSTNYVGVEFLGKTGGTNPGSCGGTITTANELDASGMTHFHADVWTPDDSSNFQIKLVDAGADGKIDGTDTAGVATITAGSSPALATGKWLSYDLALATDFPGLANFKHMGQMVFVAPNGGTVYLDNLYFWK